MRQPPPPRAQERPGPAGTREARELRSLARGESTERSGPQAKSIHRLRMRHGHAVSLASSQLALLARLRRLPKLAACPLWARTVGKDFLVPTTVLTVEVHKEVEPLEP